MAGPQDAPVPAVEQDGISVLFSPAGGCTEAIVHEIAAAKESIQVQAYGFTSAPIAKAVVEAHRRGVKVTVVLDDDQNKGKQYTEATFLANQQIPVFLDGKHAIAHNKVMILDGSTIITGSFNFTKAAEESNAENLLVIHGKPKIAEAYARNFQEHLAHAVAYQREEGQEKATAPPAPPAQVKPEEKAETKEQTPSEDPIVHVTKSGKKYHCAGCKSLSKSDIPLHLSEAKTKGFGPCGTCHPPE